MDCPSGATQAVHSARCRAGGRSVCGIVNPAAQARRAAQHRHPGRHRDLELPGPARRGHGAAGGASSPSALLDHRRRHRAHRVAVDARHRHRRASTSSRARTSARPSRRSARSATRSCASCRRASQPPNILQYNASNVPVAQLTVKSDSLTEQELFDYGLNFLRAAAVHHPRALDARAVRRAQRGRSWSTSTRADAGARRVGRRTWSQALLDEQRDPARRAGAHRRHRVRRAAQLVAAGRRASSTPCPVKVVNGVTGAARRRRARARRLRRADEHRPRQRPARDLPGDPQARRTPRRWRWSTPSASCCRRSRRPRPRALELKIDFDQSVFVRAAISERAARGGHRRGAGVADDPVLPGQLAHAW